MRLKAGRRLKDVQAVLAELPEAKLKQLRRRKRKIDYYTRYKKGRKKHSEEVLIECLFDEDELERDEDEEDKER